MEPWRDATSPNWMLHWGSTEATDWLEKELALSPGSYRLDDQSDRLWFRAPLYGEMKELFIYDLLNEKNEFIRKVALGEITNGIYAQGYWRGMN